ncbi:hypothetical protein BsWGS_02583 [Bradybaena similaris]
MLLYILPVDVLSFYFSRIHGLLVQQGHPMKGLACVTAYCLCRLLYKLLQSQHNTNKRVARRKDSQHKYESLLQAMDELHHPVDISITDLPFHELCVEMTKQTRHADDVLIAFQIRAVSTDVNTNAIVALLNAASSAAVVDVNVSAADVVDDNNPEDKLESDEATSSGTSQQKSEQPMLLSNMPISLAEVIHLQSLDATAGLSSYLQLEAKEDAVVVQMLKAQGAIPVMRTNIPQTAYITFGSSNPLFGTTKNPFRWDRSPGGTCSGEAVIAAARGSVLGVGTDVAGGLRIPAHFCGVCGFKPTSGRVSRRGVTVPLEGQTAVATCVGPMSSEVNGLVTFMKCVCVPLQHQLDPTVSMLPFNTEMYESTTPLRVGFFVDDGHTKCVPSVRRAVMEAKALLEELGYHLVPFEPPDLLYMLAKLYLPAVLGDHFFTLVRTLSVDSLDKCVRRAYFLLHLPYAVRWLWSWWFYWKNHVNSSVLAVRCPQSVSYWWKLVKEVAAWRQQFVGLMAADNLDVLLCPVMPFAAVRLGSEEGFTGCLTYSALFNLLDFPAGTVPVSTVTAGDIADLKKPEKYKVETSLERQIQADQLGFENQPGSSSQHLPVGVQIASLPYQDEMVLRVLGDLEKKASWNLRRPQTEYEI